MLGVRWSVGASLSVDHSTQTGVLQDLLAPVFSDDEARHAAPDPYATRQEYLAALAAGETIPAQYLMSYDSFEISLALNTGYRFKMPSAGSGVRGSVSSRLRYIDYDPLLYRPFEESVRDNLGRVELHRPVLADGLPRRAGLLPQPVQRVVPLARASASPAACSSADRHYIRTDTAAWRDSCTLFSHAGLREMGLVESSWPRTRASPSSCLSSTLRPRATGWGWGTVTDSTDLLYIDGMTVGTGLAPDCTARRCGTTRSSCARRSRRTS